MATFEEATKFVIGLTQQQLVAKAKQLNKEIMGADPRPLAVVRHVDGVQDAPEETVKPDGVIVYDYDRLDQVVEFALETLRQLSPVDSGDYARGHVVMLNGEVVDGLAGWKPGDRVTISNPEPYARKIEIGKNGYRANGHVYDKAAQIVARRFGNMVDTSVEYETAPPGAIHEWAGKTKSGSRRGGNSANHTEWLTRQPTLLIEEIG
jgi:hypothetical protein